MERENYYLILELPFDPPEENQEIIEERIQKKNRYWSKYAEDPNLGMVCKKYLSYIPEIKVVMLHPAKRRAEAREAAKIMYARIEKQLRIISKRGYLFESEIKALASSCKVEDRVIRKVCTVKIIPDEPEEVEITSFKSFIPEEDAPKFCDRYDQAKPYLEALNKKDFYDFLNYTGTMQRISFMPAKRLLELTNKFEIRNAKHTAQESAVEKLNKMCKDTFSTEEGKKDYDRYLLWNEVGEIFEQIQMATKVKKVLSKEQQDEIIKQLVSIQGDECYCRNLFLEYCQKNRIQLEGRAEKREHPMRGEVIKEEAVKEENTFLMTRINEVKTLMSAKKYCAAKEVLMQIKRIEGSYKDEELEAKIIYQINLAAKFLKTARSTKVENYVVAACADAYEACADFPGIKEQLLRYPVRQPTKLQIFCNLENRCNELKWEYPESKVMIQFYVVRKHDSKPANMNDGELLTIISTTSFVDTTMLPGHIYYYAVFANRLGMLSPGIVYPMYIQQLYEVLDVICVSTDRTVRVEWKLPISEVMVEVYKKPNVVPKQPGDGEVYHNITPYGFVDRDVENDRIYGYRIFAVYTYNNRKYYSQGRTVLASPHVEPKEVEYVTTKALNSKNRYLIEWEEPDENLVRFYSSSTIPNFQKGSSVSMAEVAMKMNYLQVNHSGAGKGFFTIEEGIHYIVAVTVKKEEGVIGAMTAVVNIEGMKIKGVTNGGGAIHILGEWPQGAQYLMVFSHKDMYPSSYEDTSAQKIRIMKNEFERTKTIKIEKLVDQDYYFLVYAYYRFRGEDFASQPSKVVYRTSEKKLITYEIRKKGIFRKRIEVVFVSEKKEWNLPGMLLITATGHPPVFRESGYILARIPARKVKGKYRYELPIDQVTENSYMKVFIEQPEEEKQYQLSLKYGFSSRIS